jgi:hypothetical protein
MNQRLHKLAAIEAEKELQNAYGALFLPDGDTPDLEKAEKHLKVVHEWLLALKSEGGY